MEEARQHSVVKTKWIAFAVLYFGGLLTFAIGIALQFIVGGNSLELGLMVYACSRLVIALWQTARPRSDLWKPHAPKLAPLYAIIWGIVGGLLVMALRRHG